jgi:hypothetical protein
LDNRVFFPLWKAKVPLKDIRNQLKMSVATLRRILTVAKNNPDDPCLGWKLGSGKKSKISLDTLRAMGPIQ